MGHSRGRRAAEEARDASEEQYRLLFERNLAGILLYSTGQTIVDANEASRILRYSRDELIGLHRADAFVDPAEAGVTWTQSHQQRAVTN